MLYFDIDYTIISEISTFLYVHRNKVEQLDRFIIKDFKNTLKLDIPNSERLYDIPFSIGYGTYYYNIDEQSKIEIKYFQKGEPVGTESQAKIYNGITVGCETMELWEKFNNEIAEFIEQFNKKDKNKYEDKKDKNKDKKEKFKNKKVEYEDEYEDEDEDE